MSRISQEAVTTFAEVLSTAGVSYHQQIRHATADSEYFALRELSIFI